MEIAEVSRLPGSISHKSYIPQAHASAALAEAEEDEDDQDPMHLPRYANAIYLRAEMPRKLEFTAPGVQARDRKWRRVVCEIEGTVLRLWHIEKRAGWWERRIGVGDLTDAITTQPASRPTTALTTAQPEERKDGGQQTELRVPLLLPPPQPAPVSQSNSSGNGSSSLFSKFKKNGQASTPNGDGGALASIGKAAGGAAPAVAPSLDAWLRAHAHLPFFDAAEVVSKVYHGDCEGESSRVPLLEIHSHAVS